MGFSTAEIAFYDALANNQSAQDLMGYEVLKEMARELASKPRGNLSIHQIRKRMRLIESYSKLK